MRDSKRAGSTAEERAEVRSVMNIARSMTLDEVDMEGRLRMITSGDPFNRPKYLSQYESQLGTLLAAGNRSERL